MGAANQPFILFIRIYLLVVVVEITKGFSLRQMQMQLSSSNNHNNIRNNNNNRRNGAIHHQQQQLNSHSTTSSTSNSFCSSGTSSSIGVSSSKRKPAEIEKVIMTKTKSKNNNTMKPQLPPSFDVKACWSKAGIGTCFVLQEMTQKKFEIVFDIGW